MNSDKFITRLSALLTLLAGVSASAMAVSLDIPDFSVNRGYSASVEVCVETGEEGMFEYQGFQFNLFLPDGVSLENATLAQEVSETGFTLTSKEYDGGVYKFMAYSRDDGSSAPSVLHLDLKADETAEVGEFTASLRNVVFSAPDGRDIDLDDSTVTIEVTVPASSLKLSLEDFSLATDAAPVLVSAEISPAETSLKELNWTAEPEGIVRVEYLEGPDTSVLVFPLAEGMAVLTASTVDGSKLTANCTVTVVRLTEIEIGLGDNSGADDGRDDDDIITAGGIKLYVGESVNFAVKTKPEVDFAPEFDWVIDNAEVAEVFVAADDSRQAEVTGIGKGETSLTISTVGESPLSATSNVTVLESLDSVEEIFVLPESEILAIYSVEGQYLGNDLSVMTKGIYIVRTTTGIHKLIR